MKPVLTRAFLLHLIAEVFVEIFIQTFGLFTTLPGYTLPANQLINGNIVP